MGSIFRPLCGVAFYDLYRNPVFPVLQQIFLSEPLQYHIYIRLIVDDSLNHGGRTMLQLGSASIALMSYNPLDISLKVMTTLNI